MVIMAEAQVIPTPKALNNSSVLSVSLFFSSLTIVSGTDTDEVLPYFSMVVGILSVLSFSFLAK
jgi:hypothetical protein